MRIDTAAILPMSKPKLYSYIRWSSEKQGKGTSLARQKNAAREYADSHGLEMVEMIDSGLSAFKGKNLGADSALGSFILAVEAGAVASDSWLYVEHLDRLSRQDVTTANELFLRLLNLGLTIVTGIDRKPYTKESVNKNPIDLMMSILSFAKSNEESKTKQIRTNGNALELIAQHKDKRPVNIKSIGKHPFWIDDTGPANESVKKHPIYWNVAKDAIGKFLEGAGIYTVIKHLNEHFPEGIDGNSWDYQAIRRLRKNKALIGERTLKVRGVEYKLDNYYPALCTETEFAQLQDITKNNKYSLGGESDSIKLLSGLRLFRCGRCGGTMSGFLQRGKLRYICLNGRHLAKGCIGWSVQGKIVEHCLIIILLIGYLDDTRQSTNSMDDINSTLIFLGEKLATLDAGSKNLTRAIEEGAGKIETVVKRMMEIESERSTILIEIDRLKQKKLVIQGEGDVSVKMIDFLELVHWDVISDHTNTCRGKIREITRQIMSSVIINKIDGKISIQYQYKKSDVVYIFEGGSRKPDWTHYTIIGTKNGDTDNAITPQYVLDNKHFQQAIRLTSEMKKFHSKLYETALEMLDVVGYPKINGKDFWPVR